MTVINNIEIDNIKYNPNIIKDAIVNNLPIEDKLNVIIVISNPCQYATRYIFAREFIKRIEMEETHVNLYIVELAYNNQEYYVTQKNNPKHLQLRGMLLVTIKLIFLDTFIYIFLFIIFLFIFS